MGVLDAAVLVGYRDGHLELRRFADEGEGVPTFQDVASSRVAHIASGPAGTVAVGYANGLVGLWSLRDGTLLASERLHGQITHISVDAQGLVAVTDLGDHLSWDLGAFYAPYCELLKAVWAGVPVVWQGRPVPSDPPGDHPCGARP